MAAQAEHQPSRRYQAAICEDDVNSLSYIEQLLDRAFASSNMPMTFEPYDKPERLFADIEHGAQYDVLFLDIDMPKLNGIELTRQLREAGSQTAVVFISNKEEMVFQTFEVQPLYFLRKSHFLEGLPHLVQAVSRELQTASKTLVTIEELHSNNVYSFDIQQLMFIEAMGKQCLFTTATGKTKIQCRLGALTQQLTPYGFVQCHRSYLVNCRFIFSIGKDSLTLDNRGMLPIGRSHRDAVKAAFMALMNGSSAAGQDAHSAHML